MFARLACRVGLRWAVRPTGVISVLILPAAASFQRFWVVVIAIVVLVLFKVLMSWNGQELAIIRHTTAIPDHYNTAWTISALIVVVIAARIILVAPLAKIYFHGDRAPAGRTAAPQRVLKMSGPSISNTI
jgi:hypothetical protein